MLIGRTEERKKLENAYRSEYSEFIAVYGRRRVGKTFLIRETFGYRFSFQHAGLSKGNMKVQIDEFCRSLYKAGMKGVLDRNFRKPANWGEAFFLLETFLDQSPGDQKKIVFIDELSWMDTPKSDLIPALESFWNGWASARKDILLIICASATSWILNKVVHDKGGLHNRLTGQIKLNPFTLKECEMFVFSKNIVMNRYQILECYMIMGGIPYYWKFLEKGKSLEQNIDNIFFADDAPLRDEFKYLYQALFKKPEVYIQFVTALGKKKAGMTRDELIEAADVTNSGAVTKKLEELENCGFIRKYYEFGNRRKDAVYQLIDNFTLFYFKFMDPMPSDHHFWENNLDSPTVNAWCGLAFERVCLEHIPQIKNRLGISGVLTQTNAWSCSADLDRGIFGSQIDLLIVRRDQIINLCEMKYSRLDYTVSKETDLSIKRKIHDFRTITKTKYAIHPTIITPYGLMENSYAGNIRAVITAEDLFQ